MKFEAYPWQQKQWQQMVNAHKADRIPHSALLIGSEGVGVDHYANCLSAYLLCRNKDKDYACGNCKSCNLFITKNHPDMYMIEPEEYGGQIKVDDIRSLIKFVQLSSQYDSNKIVVINPADSLNRHAANTLLKTLEEPPPGVLFFLVTSKPAKLPVTIRSRCQRIFFPKVSQDLGIKWLNEVTNMTKEEAKELIGFAQGCPTLALELLETEVPLKQNEVLSDLQMLAKTPTDITIIAQKWHKYGTPDVLFWLASFFCRMTMIKLNIVRDTDKLSQGYSDLQKMVTRLELCQLIACYSLAVKHYQVVTGPFNLNHIGILEDFIIYWQSENVSLIDA